MTISELVSELERHKAEIGDVEVRLARLSGIPEARTIEAVQRGELPGAPPAVLLVQESQN